MARMEKSGPIDQTEHKKKVEQEALKIATGPKPRRKRKKNITPRLQPL